METKLFEEGAFVQVNSPVIEGWHKCNGMKELLANQDPCEENIKDYTLKWTGKSLPREIMGDVLALVSHFPRTEVDICLYYNVQKAEWLAHVPKQRGSAAHVAYNDEYWQEPTGFYMSGTIHTHPEMGAFWSGTDTNDQCKHNGIHVVLSLREGKLNDYLVSLSYNGQLYPQDKSLVEIPEEIPEVKQDWLARVQEDLPPEPKVAVEAAKWKHPTGNWFDQEDFDYYRDLYRDLEERYLGGYRSTGSSGSFNDYSWDSSEKYEPLTEDLYMLSFKDRYDLAKELLESLGETQLSDMVKAAAQKAAVTDEENTVQDYGI